jgi:hypothetical protein
VRRASSHDDDDGGDGVAVPDNAPPSERARRAGAADSWPSSIGGCTASRGRQPAEATTKQGREASKQGWTTTTHSRRPTAQRVVQPKDDDDDETSREARQSREARRNSRVEDGIRCSVSLSSGIAALSPRVRQTT